MYITNGEFQVQPTQEGLSHGGLILQRSSQSHLDWQQLPGSNFPTVVHSSGKVQHWAKCTVGSWWLVKEVSKYVKYGHPSPQDYV